MSDLRCQSEMSIWNVNLRFLIWDVNLRFHPHAQTESCQIWGVRLCQSEMSIRDVNLRCLIWDVNLRCQSEMSHLRCQSEISDLRCQSEISPPRSNRELSDLRCQIVNARFTWSEIIIFNHNRKGRVCRFQWISSLFEDLNVLDIWYTHRGTTESGHFCCDFLSDIYHVCEKKMVSA